MDPQEALARFFSSVTKEIAYKKGEIIMRPDDAPQGVYFVLKGYVRFYTLSKEGEELTFLLLGPGDFFPVRWALTGQQLAYYYEAMTPVVLQRAAKDRFVAFLETNPGVLVAITGAILTRLKTVFDRMEYLAYGNAYEKVASIIYVFARDYGAKEGRQTLVRIPLTHQDIASLIGVTRETVTVEMGKLSDAGVITHKGKALAVENMEKLRKESLLQG